MEKNRKKQLEEVEKIAKEINDPTLLKTVQDRKKDKTISKNE
jgi:hypothetical protein